MSVRMPLDGAIVHRLGRESRMNHRRLAAGVGLVIALLLVAPVALGHAELETVTPADKSTVEGSPAEIVMTFGQDLDPAKSSIVVVDAAGKVVAQGGTVPVGEKREMDLALETPLAPGTYTIRWTTFSAEDQEQARGTTTFTMAAAPSIAPTVAPSAAPPSASPSASSAPSVIPSPSPSAPPTTPASSTSDAVIPIVVALIVLAALGLWLLRGRSRRAR
jgi:methionine-rich copper-binding protein CopC